jgi:chromatin segregation and condensation protein Rec8/ScpA/Scc1 (kleisin family)
LIEYNKDRKDIQIDRMTEEFCAWVEEQASALEITADYFILEFL